MSQSTYFKDRLYIRMAEDLHLGGMDEATYAGCLRAVRSERVLTDADSVVVLLRPVVLLHGREMLLEELQHLPLRIAALGGRCVNINILNS